MGRYDTLTGRIARTILEWAPSQGADGEEDELIAVFKEGQGKRSPDIKWTGAQLCDVQKVPKGAMRIMANAKSRPA